MKKNLNIAYLNGTDGIIRKTAGEGDNSEDAYQYYRIDQEIYDGSFSIDTLPFIVLAKGEYADSASPVNGIKIISSPYFVGPAMTEQIMCYNGKSIIGDREINEGDWKKNVCEHMFALFGASEEIQTPEDMLHYLDCLIPITKEEFYSLETQS